MRLATYQIDSGPRAGAIRTNSQGFDELVDLNDNDRQLPLSLREFVAMGEKGLQRAAQIVKSGDAVATLSSSQETPKLLPPITVPQKIICVGLNYADHAAETGAKVGDEPVIFNKFPTCLRGHLDPIELPSESEQVDYEAELVVVIGREARHVSQAQAWDYVAGYCCGHDVSARDWQKGKPGGQWLLGKSFDSFAPLGPYIVTRDEIPEPGNLGIQLKLNGQVMQNSNTNQLIFPIDMLVAYLSNVCTLLPGDLIYTGTPPGVGMARKPPVFLRAGDVVEVSIDGLGTLRNRVIG